MLLTKLKKGLLVLTAALTLALPTSASAAGLFSSREGGLYKQAGTEFKMPNSMYANQSDPILKTIPTVFWSVFNSNETAGIDVGLMYVDGGWKFESWTSYGNIRERKSNNSKDSVIIRKRNSSGSLQTSETLEVNNGQGYVSQYSAKSQNVLLSYQADQVITLNSYVFTIGSDYYIRFETYDAVSTSVPLIQVDVPLNNTFGAQINTSGGKWNRQFSFANNDTTFGYLKDGSYAWDAQFRNGWFINGSTWTPISNSNSQVKPKIHVGSYSYLASDYANVHADQKIGAWSQQNGSHSWDMIWINHNNL